MILIYILIWIMSNMALSNKSTEKCCVPNCDRTRLDGTILHTFPNPEKDPDRFRTWLYAIGGDILAKDNKYIHKYRRVCHHHFQTRFHTASNRLCANAVPSLNLPKFLVKCNKPEQEVGTVMNVEILHRSDNDNASDNNLSNPSCSNISKKPLEEVGNINVGINELDEAGDENRSNSSFNISKKPLEEVGNINVEISQSDKAKDENQSNPSPIKLCTATQTDEEKITKPVSKGLKSRSEVSLLKQKIKKLQKSKDDYATKLKKALKLTENPTFLKATSNFTPAAMVLFMMQINQAKHKGNGRRYTEEEKLLSLAFYEMGPRVYSWFRNIFALPAPATIGRLISSSNLKPGIPMTKEFN